MDGRLLLETPKGLSDDNRVRINEDRIKIQNNEFTFASSSFVDRQQYRISPLQAIIDGQEKLINVLKWKLYLEIEKHTTYNECPNFATWWFLAHLEQVFAHYRRSISITEAFDKEWHESDKEAIFHWAVQYPTKEVCKIVGDLFVDANGDFKMEDYLRERADHVDWEYVAKSVEAYLYGD